MRTKNGVPCAPFGTSFIVEWEVGEDGKYVYPPKAKVGFAAKQITPFGNIGCGGSELDARTCGLDDAETATLYSLIAKMFESRLSAIQIGMDPTPEEIAAGAVAE